jgi:hypothetical protein
VSGNIIGGIIGATIGFFVGGGIVGALQGFAIGSAIGGALMPADLPTSYGPRLDDLKAQQSEYGAAIPIVYGTVALQGTVIWAKDIKEVKTETEQGGGISEPSQTLVNYNYFASFAVAVCEGPISGFLRIWAGPEKRLIYDGMNIQGGQVRFYLGTEDQMPDPLIEADMGVGFTPAYRGTAYIVLEDFPLDKDFNRIPFLTIEVSTGAEGGTCGVAYKLVGTAPNQSRLYDVPPVKIGNYGDGEGDANRRYLSAGAHPYAFDNDGNLYILIEGYDGGYRKYVQKVSTTAPIQQTLMYLGDDFNSVFHCSIAYDPNLNVLGVIQENTLNYVEVDCATFTGTYSARDYYKSDIIFSENEQRFRFLNSRAYFPGGTPHPDNYGANYIVASKLIECGPHGFVVCVTNAVLIGATGIGKAFDIYDPVRDRLLAVTGSLDYLVAYYDFATGAVVTPINKNPVNVSYRLNATYFPLIDRIIWNDANGLWVMNPADFTALSFPDECQLFGGQLVYADGSEGATYGGILTPVPIPNKRSKIIVINGGNWNTSVAGNDIFTFPVGVRGAGVTLASVVADLSERAGEPRYDVTQLEDDLVDGYVIARQTEVRAAMQVLRSAYYFDAVESQGVVRFVKRGSSFVTVIDDDDLAARDHGAEAPDPLQTARRIENELPRAVTVKYMLAADSYNTATKQARRLIGASGDETTLEFPLVLTDTKGQEVAQVNLHSAWVERLSYSFALPRKYSRLEPTDLVLVKGHLMRLTSVKATPRGVLECTALADESSYYAPNVVVSETPPNEGTVSKPGQTRLELF